jgi:hypothetical protein
MVGSNKSKIYLQYCENLNLKTLPKFCQKVLFKKIKIKNVVCLSSLYQNFEISLKVYFKTEVLVAN